MAHGHGGARRNAGRKKSEAQLLLRQAMDQVIGSKRWKRMLERVADKIEQSGDASAFYRLASMRYGLPAHMIEPDSDPRPLTIREVIVEMPALPGEPVSEDDGASQLPPADITGQSEASVSDAQA